MAILGWMVVVTLLCSRTFLDYRMRLIVFLAGGQSRMYSWGIDTLKQDRDTFLESHTDQEWRVPRSDWPRQVRWLRPRRVEIVRSFDTKHEAVSLSFGGGFHHWKLIIMPQGTEPPDDFGWPYGFCLKWCDGIYGVQEG